LLDGHRDDGRLDLRRCATRFLRFGLAFVISASANSPPRS
jgi:hypothetical protein